MKIATTITACLLLFNGATTLYAQLSPQQTTSGEIQKTLTAQTNSHLDDQEELNLDDVSTWILMQPTGANAEFRMPVKPRYIERSFTPVANEPPIKVRSHQVAFNQGNVLFKFGYHDFNVAPTKETIEDALDGAVSGSFSRVSGKLLEHGRIKEGDLPGRAFIFIYAHAEKIYKAHSRVVIDGKRQYQITSIMAEVDFDDELAKRFLSTFRIAKPDDDLPPRPPVKKKSAVAANGSDELK